MIRRALHIFVTVVLSAIVVASVAWGALALWIDGPNSLALAGTMAGGFALICILLAALVRPFLKGLVAALLPVVAVAVWWASIPPSNTRDWPPEVARTARADFHGSSVTIQNVRNFKYRSETDYDQRWERRTYDLERIRGVDLFLSFWGPTQIAHTIVSWEFDDGQHLAISIETAKRKANHTRRCAAFSASTNFIMWLLTSAISSDCERITVGSRYTCIVSACPPHRHGLCWLTI